MRSISSTLYSQVSLRRGRPRGGSSPEIDPAGQLAHDEQVGALDRARAGADWRHSSAGERAGRGAGWRTARAPLRRPSNPCSGRPAAGRSCPTSDRPRPRAARPRRARHASIASSVSAVPWRRSPRRRSVLLVRRSRATSSRMWRVAARISGPMPSPGSVTMVGMGCGTLADRRGDPLRAGLDLAPGEPSCRPASCAERDVLLAV